MNTKTSDNGDWPMETNVSGQVRNTQLAKDNGLYALFESIVNGIQAIEDVNKSVEDGKIDIVILRSNTLFSKDDNHDSPINGFSVRDNGIGFTDQNFVSFNETNSEYKFNRGGKGVGRFTWLKVFERATIESVFCDNGDYFRRNFTFSTTTKLGISGHVRDQFNGNGSYTQVVLNNVQQDYRKSIPLNIELIAARIVEHFLEFFVLRKMPKTYIIDNGSQNVIDLWDFYETMKAENQNDVISIGGYTFYITHFMLYNATSKDHRLYFTGNQRVGYKTPSLQNKVPNLPKYFTVGNKEKCVYAGYISSKYLDKNLNDTRTGFTIPNKNDGSLFEEELDWDTILNGIYKVSAKYLEPYTKPVEEEKNKRIKNYIEEKYPEYRYLYKHRRNLIDYISPDATETDMDIELHKIARQVETELKEQAFAFFEEEKKNTSSEKYYAEREIVYRRFFSELNDHAKSQLAKYILERKLVLDVFENSLKRRDSGKYALEAEIHRLIYPMGKSSDDVLPNDHNLWILDERLAYHQYLTSDKPLKQIERLENSSDVRPDLVVFNRRFVMTDEPDRYTTGIVIFEFKRPMREGYEKDEDPLTQVYRYITEIRNGKIIDKNGRPIKVHDGTPFYSYVVCDITDKVQQAATISSLPETPDKLGYAGFHSGYRTYIEIISYDKLLQDAKKRNQALFEKLGLPAVI